MDTREAMDELGLGAETNLATARSAYRALVRTVHPDVAGTSDDTHRRTVRLTEAYGIVVAYLLAQPQGVELPAESVAAGDEPESSAPTDADANAVQGTDVDGPESSPLDEATIIVEAPSAETYGALYDAASRVGEITYYDRTNGIIETMVRFEGGPSCSVLMTLQGRAHYTEVFCTMDSIEAAPAPPIAPVIDALVTALQTP